MKIYFNYNLNATREGFETYHPEDSKWYENANVDEIAGENVLEKIKDIIYFIEMCEAVLKPGGVCNFTAPYYDNWQAYEDPRNIRSLSQGSLNFADKKWREQKGCAPLAKCDFEVGCNMAIDLLAVQRSDAAKEFWMNRYKNVIQSLLFTLKKKEE